MLGRMGNFITCISEGMERCLVKPVSYDRVKEVTQEKEVNFCFILKLLLGAISEITLTPNHSQKTRSPNGHRFYNIVFSRY